MVNIYNGASTNKLMDTSSDLFEIFKQWIYQPML